jgi:glycosyltransferase involved in cell wall biosynthesis
MGLQIYKLKVHILYPIRNGPFGGGNTFLRTLRKYLVLKGHYTNDKYKSDLILFNLNPVYQMDKLIWDIKKIKSVNPSTLIVGRIDGPTVLVRGMDFELDKYSQLFSEYIADGIVFQSSWSRCQNYKIGFKKNKHETKIINAPDSECFNSNKKIRYLNNQSKTKLIASSWSSNWSKGFETFQWLDQNLDFEKYEFRFFGKSPIKFENIIMSEPVDSITLSKALKGSDIFINASLNEACSNALIEAMHCGLPAIAFNGTGNPEIIKNGGELFNTNSEIINKLELIKNNYYRYTSRINLPSIERVGDQYLEFFILIYSQLKTGMYKPKKTTKNNYKNIVKQLNGTKYEPEGFGIIIKRYIRYLRYKLPSVLYH